VKAIVTVPLNQNVENRLFEFMNRDRISHFYAIFDLKHLGAKTKAWVALSNNKIIGYLMEYDKRILYMRGHQMCASPLLRNSDLASPWFNIEPKHLPTIKRLYKPTEPADKATVGLVTTFTTMKATQETFNPVQRHKAQELTKENAKALAELLDIEPQQTQGFFTGLTYGIFKGNKLVSFAGSPEMLEDLAIIRGVQTAPEERNKGYSTSVCSALVQKLIQQGKNVMLYVSKDNPAAVKVYRKIGFKETGREFLGFMAKKRNVRHEL